MNFALTFVTLKYEFFQGFISGFCFYDAVNGFGFIIWRYHNPAVWAWKVSSSFNFSYVDLED